MPRLKIPGKLEELLHEATDYTRVLNERSHGWLGILAAAAGETFTSYSTMRAATIAYYSLFSLFPLILVSIYIASFNLIPLLDQQFILTRLEFVAPALRELLGKNIDHIITARGPVTLVALIGLIWSASAIFFTLTQTLNDIWGSRRRRSYWKRRGLAILLVVGFAGPALVLASMASSVISLLRTWVPDQIVPLGNGLSLILAILLDIGFFMLIYRMFPHGTSTWHEILPGAIAAGLLWELAKKAFLSFVTTYLYASNLVYGSLAAIIAFLTWAYLSGLIFLFGANLSLSYFNLKQGQQEETGQ